MTQNCKVENVKKGMFKRWDIAVYALIAALIAILVVVFAFNGTSADVFIAYINGEKVMEYSFADNSYIIYDPDRVEVLSDTQFKFICDGGYNVLIVDKDDKDAFITDADCAGKECKAMKLSAGTIICAPHNLTVKAVGRVTEPVVG